jgi:DNA modification methylase/DNA-directed RNA polymerase subunit RPC12/RpoP
MRITMIINHTKNENSLEEFINNENKTAYRFNPQDFEDMNDKDRLSNPIFKAFGYPSKIYYPNIQKFIRAYSKEGGVVLDSFCGSGTTGIAALLENRKALLVDSSPNAIHTTKNTFSYINIKDANSFFKIMKDELADLINNLYKTKTSDGKNGYAESIISSNIYSCLECNSEIALHGTATKNRSEYACSNCGFILNISKKEHKERLIERRKPVEVNIRITDITTGRKTEKRPITSQDMRSWESITNEYEAQFGHLWSPLEKIVYNRCYPRIGGWPGFPIDSTVSDLFPKQGLIALKIIRNYIVENLEDVDIRNFFMFVFTESLFRSSKRLFTTSGIKNVYHVPPVGKEQNVLTVFERKFKTIIKAKEFIQGQISLDDSSNKMKILKHNAKSLPIPNNSLDYAFIDPPYGGVVPYAELNLFYSAWLNEKEDLENEVIIPMDYEKKIEFVHDWGKQIEGAFNEVFRVLKPGAYFTIVFQSKFNDIWNELRDLMTNRIGFQFVNIVGNERSTTFHTNHLNDTNPQSAFITYRKPLLNEIAQLSLNIQDGSIFKNYPLEHLNTKRTFREIQSFIINLVHELNFDKIPSDSDIKNWLKVICIEEVDGYILKK